jgi:hypothetical protein
MDGEFVDWADATVHVLTHTMHYGSGVFEGIRAYPTPSGSRPPGRWCGSIALMTGAISGPWCTWDTARWV